jgi:nucleoside 2-deoxyribosyltransferase
MDATVQAIVDTLSPMNIESFVFVDRYCFSSAQEKEMMVQAFSDIEQSDFLIAETSEKAIGVGVEVGYAKAKQKPVIYLRQSTAEHSTTLAGTSDYQVVYEDAGDLQLKLGDILIKHFPNSRGLLIFSKVQKFGKK